VTSPSLTTADFPSPTLEALEAAGRLKAPELHPSTRELMRQLSRYGGLTDRVSVAYARRQLQRAMPLTATMPDVASVVDRTISGPIGPIQIRIVTPQRGREPRPAIVWFGGGGFVIGDLVTAEPTARNLANRLGAVVVCVDYRKAPEHGLDDAYDDALAAVRWVFDQADALGVDDTRIGVGGDSAGGNVAAVVAQEHSVDTRKRPLAVQVLVYPTVSGENEPARARNADGGPLNPSAVRWFETHVAGAFDPESRRYWPLMAEDLSSLPPAVVVTAGYDPLRDEAIVYLDRLRDAGLRADHLHYADDVHGFFTMDLVLHNGALALDDVADAVADILQIDEAARGLVELSALDGLWAGLAHRHRRLRTVLTQVVERGTHAQRRLQRRLIQLSGLPAGRDVEVVNDRIARLELQLRSLRRQLDRLAAEPPDDEEPSAS
jgi:acetyl esterase